MESLSLIVTLILVCLSLIALLIMAKPIKFIFSVLINAVLGAGGIFAANFFLLPFGISLGINLLTLSFVGVLGIPGFCALLLISALLR